MIFNLYVVVLSRFSVTKLFRWNGYR